MVNHSTELTSKIATFSSYLTLFKILRFPLKTGPRDFELSAKVGEVENFHSH